MKKSEVVYMETKEDWKVFVHGADVTDEEWQRELSRAEQEGYRRRNINGKAKQAYRDKVRRGEMAYLIIDGKLHPIIDDKEGRLQ